jgi:O-antigen/teichoic acid export membrane protein
VGTIRYGIWVILFAVVDYFNLLDFGTGAATIKYVADYYTKKNMKRIGQVVALTFIFNCIYIPILIAAYLFSDQILFFFHIEFIYLEEAKFIFIGVLANFAVSQLAGVLRSTLIGIQRIHINNMCEIVYLFLYAGCVLLILSNGYGLQEIVIMMLCLRCARMIFNMIYMLSLMPSAVKGLNKIDLKMCSSFFSYGAKLQLASLAGFFNFQIDKMLIGHYLKIEFVAFYEIGAKLAMMIRHIPSVMMGPLIPASAELIANRDTTRLNELYLRSNFYIILVAAPISAFFIVNSREIVEIWLGEFAHPYCALALRVLSVAFFFQMLSSAVASIARGIGIVRYEIQSSALNAVLNISLSVILIFKFGFLGALLGTTVAMAISNIIYLIRFSRFMKIGLSKVIERILIKPVMCALIPAIICYLFKNIYMGSIVISNFSRMEALLRLLLVGIVYLFLFVAGLFLSRAIGRSDLQLFGRAVAAIGEFK